MTTLTVVGLVPGLSSQLFISASSIDGGMGCGEARCAGVSAASRTSSLSHLPACPLLSLPCSRVKGTGYRGVLMQRRGGRAVSAQYVAGAVLG